MSGEDASERGSAEAHRRELTRLREIAAGLASSGENTAALADHLEDLVADADFRGGSAQLARELPDELLAGTRASAARSRLVSEVSAAQAIAEQEMLDAGGPENDEAYAAFVEATEWHTGLLPNGNRPPDDDPIE